MIALLSPAKNMNFAKSNGDLKTSSPVFIEESYYLIQKLKKLSPRQIGKMLNISAQLSDLNHNRYGVWNKEYQNVDKKPAMFAFNGEVYRGLGAENFNNSEIEYANDHLLILSGLHGLLKPLDMIQPYRLEMGARFAVTKKQNNLYKFWGDKVSMELNKLLTEHKNKEVINLASNEYWKVVNPNILEGKVIHCQFLDLKNGEYKTVMTWAKNARGMMANQIISNQVDTVEELKDQKFNGYQFNDNLSSSNNFIFSRDAA